MTSDASVRGGLPPRVRRPFGILGHPLVQLTLVRVREFVREPEAVFWAIFFPILLTSGLGIAFRSRPPEVLKVASTSQALAQAIRSEAGLSVETLSADAARQALRVGTIALVAEQTADGVLYRYDETNPEGRTARALADRAVQRAAGRTDPVAAGDALVREPGSRYIDFLVPGLVGLGIMSNAVWGIGFSIVDGRRRKLTKRLVATPMSRTYYLASYLVWRMVILVFEVGLPIGFGALAFGVPVRGRLLDLAVICVFASVSFSALGLLIASPGPHDRSGLEPDEPAAGPDVDPVGRLLLGSAVSGDRAADYQGPAPDGVDRCDARAHAAGSKPDSGRAAARHAGRVARGLLHAGVEAVPVALSSASPTGARL